VTKRELNQQTAQVLASVAVGEPVEVTERGIARWRIEVVTASVDPIERLRAAGRLVAPRADPAPWPASDEAPRYTPEEIDRLFSELRGDR